MILIISECRVVNRYVIAHMIRVICIANYSNKTVIAIALTYKIKYQYVLLATFTNSSLQVQAFLDDKFMEN